MTDFLEKCQTKSFGECIPYFLQFSNFVPRINSSNISEDILLEVISHFWLSETSKILFSNDNLLVDLVQCIFCDLKTRMKC